MSTSTTSPDLREVAPSRIELAGLFFISAATLVLEICLTRILAVSLWYHFAFMVISTALFGLGLAGTVLAVRRQPGVIPARLPAIAACSTPPAFVLGFAIFNATPFEPFSLATQPLQSLWLIVGFSAVTLPFLASGITVGALFTRYPTSSHAVYTADLVGAGFGCILALPVLATVGGGGSVMAAAAVAAVGGACIARPVSRRLAIGAVATVVVLGALAPATDRFLPIRITDSKALSNQNTVGDLLRDSRFHRYTEWNGVSRIDVVEFPDRRRPEIGHRTILIDAGNAATRLVRPGGPIDELGPTDDELAFFVGITPEPRVAILGSGGGREVLLAVRNGASEVFGVEVNPGINRILDRIMLDHSGGLARHPRVDLVTAEGRSWMRRQSEPFDLIISPHTITNAALASGSLSLFEDFMATREAFIDFLERLSPEGVLVVTRPETHLPRLIATARAALAATGEVETSHAIVAWRGNDPGPSYFGGMAIRKGGFSETDVDAFGDRLERRGLEALYLPGQPSDSLYTRLIAGTEPDDIDLPYPTILEPATDDRPYFNQRTRLSSLSMSDLIGVFTTGRNGLRSLERRPVAEAILVVVALETTLAALLLVGFPLWLGRRRAANGGGATALVFGGLGVAYIIAELGFLQRFGLYIGQPTLLLATVLATLLIGSGIGAWWSRRLSGRPWFSIAPLVAGVTVGATAIAAPVITTATLGLPLGGRIALTALLLAPAGFVMGVPFPLFLRRLGHTRRGLIPLAWAANGVGSVAGSVVATMVGMTVGFSAALGIGALCYLAVAAASRPLTDSG
jgi:hypothetical protein